MWTFAGWTKHHGIRQAVLQGLQIIYEQEWINVAKITAKKRKSLPKSSFGQPATRAYPMPDKAHAANAKARATQQLKKGNLSKSAHAAITAKANKKLGTSTTKRKKRTTK